MPLTLDDFEESKLDAAFYGDQYAAEIEGEGEFSTTDKHVLYRTFTASSLKEAMGKAIKSLNNRDRFLDNLTYRVVKVINKTTKEEHYVSS